MTATRQKTPKTKPEQLPAFCSDELPKAMIRYNLQGLCLTGDELEMAYKAVLKIMQSGHAFKKYAVHCGGYQSGIIIDGFCYEVNWKPDHVSVTPISNIIPRSHQ